MSASNPESKPYQRVVTGHDENGRAIFKSDEMFTPQPIPSGDAAFSLIWSTAAVPVDNNDEIDGRDRPQGLTLNNGSAIRITDMYPGEASPFHRTNSIDYGIVVEGEIELELDDGRKTTVKQGGVIVQRGTMHLWRNTTDKIARIVFILIEAAPYLHNGEPLADDRPEGDH